MVGRNDGVNFVGDSQSSTFSGVKFHFPFLFPILEGVEVFLKDFRIMGRFDSSVKVGIVRKKSYFSTRGQAFGDIIDVNEKE